ncbi:putative HAD-hydrolase YfnB [Lachnospiraceae bacterium]|nr:putative HAD-hydrolase YfnB [Lachnospiraceae bacterium]
MYKNYIFDLYGTLIDIYTDEYSKNFFKKYAKWLRRQGFHFEWKLFYKLYTTIEREHRKKAELAGRYTNPEIMIEKVFQEVFAENGYELSEEQVQFLCAGFRRTSLIRFCLFPDTIACLEGLKSAGKNIYLLSNAQRSFTWQELELTGLIPYFNGILISSDEGCMKPDPEFYNKCCERYHLDKAQSVMIGNELKSDMTGAAAAGIDAFYMNRCAVFHQEKNPIYQYVSPKGSLLEVLIQTGVTVKS